MLLTLLIWLKFRFIYKIKDGNEKKHFRIDGYSGLITTAASLDRETTASHQLSVVAEDVNEKCHKGLIVVEVIVLDKNDNKPKFEKSQYSVNVREDVSANQYLITVYIFINLMWTQPKVLLGKKYND